MYVSADQFIPGDKSKAEDWIAWYKLIPGGKETRNAIFLKAWAKRGAKTNIANTVALRDFLRKEAGIELTANGVGIVVDSALSVKDTIEDIFMIPIYAWAIGGALTFSLIGVLIWQGFKHPDAAGRFVGSAAGSAAAARLGFEKGGMLSSKRNLYLAGAGSVLVIALIALFYSRYKNQRIVDNIIAALDSPTDPLTGGNSPGAYNDSRDLALTQVFSPGFWRKTPDRVTIWAKNSDGSEGPAMQMARQIFEAGKFSAKSKGGSVVSVFKSLKTKADVSKLADVFAGMYKTDLYNYINRPFMTGNCDADEDNCGLVFESKNYLKQVYDWIKNQLS